MEKKKNNRKLDRTYILLSIGIALLFTLCGIFGVFTKLDFRFYDLLLHAKKEIPLNEKVVMIEIDNDSLNKLGEWPWKRNILGDVLLRMKEMGAYSASFDIEYLSPSAVGVASDARTKINENISQNKQNVTEMVNELTGAIVNGNIGIEELPELTEQMVFENIDPSYDELEEQIVNDIYFDFDEYFARCCQFFGNTYLTINMRDLQMSDIYSPEYLDYVEKRFLRKNIQDEDSLVKKSNKYEISRMDSDVPGFSPTIEVFGSRAKGASFTNSVIDDDGIRRRMEFLAEHNGRYVAQLSVGPVLDKLQVEKVIRNKRSITLIGAKDPVTGEVKDIKVPLDEHGYFIINWRHGDIEETLNYEPVLAFNNMDTSEENIYLHLCNIASLQMFDYEGNELPFTAYANELASMYDEILSMKNYLLEQCTGYDANGNPYDGITDEMYNEYFKLRQDYFSYVKEFLEAGLDKEANDFLDILLQDNSIDQDLHVEFKQIIAEEMQYLAEENNIYVELDGKIRPVVENALCIVGNTASSTTDLGAVPFIKQFANVGIHGNIMNTLMEQKFIYSFDWYFLFIFAVLVSIIPFFFSDERKLYRNLSGGLIAFISSSLFVMTFLFFDVYFPMLTAIIYLIVNYLAGVVYRFINSDKEKKFITNAFSQCLSKDVVEDIIKDPSSLKLGGDSREMTAIFTDIQKFSAFSELLNAAELVSLLNFYLTKMSDIIMDERGTVDKYEGDAIIALVGAPMTLPDHAFRACSAAIKMKKAEVLMNEQILEISKEEDCPSDMDPNLFSAIKKMVANDKTIFTRIGINSGEMVAGFMGSENKKNYTMMGNNVNLASRLEGVNKAYASSILCSENTWKLANSGDNTDKILVRRLDRVRVVNIKTPVQLYNVIGFVDEVSMEQKKEIDMFHTALDMYLERNFIEAGKLFVKANKVYHDDTALKFAERCKDYIENGVSEDWDGVLNMTTK